MSEEIKNASIIVLRAIVFSIILNDIIGFSILLAILFSIGNIDDVLKSETGYPFLTIF